MALFLFIQLPVPTLTPQEVTGNLPLAAASMILAARSISSALQTEIFPQELANRAGDAQLLNEILARKPQYLGFTCTVWSIERVRYLSQKIKEFDPSIKIIFGGPEIADDASIVLDPQAPFDWAVQGDGEPFFSAFASGILPDSIHGLLLPSGAKTDGSHILEPLTSLDFLHDPFIAGLVHPESDGVMYAELFRGCAYACSFCRYHQGRKKSAPQVRSRTQIAELFAWAGSNSINEIFLLDPSLEQRADFDDFLIFIASVNTSKIGIFCELRAEAITPYRAQLLKNAGVTCIETGLQTVNQVALRKAGRKLDIEAFTQGIRALQDADIVVRADAMIGLPGDSPDEFDTTLQFLDDNNLAQQAQIFKTQILPGTRLRKQADSLQLIYDHKPPYFVESLPTWPKSNLTEALFYAEERLDLSFAPEERPVLPNASWLQNAQPLMVKYPNTSAIMMYGYNLDIASHKQTLDDAIHARESSIFEQAGNTAMICIAGSQFAPNQKSICNGVERILMAQPYTSLTVALYLQQSIELDIFDQVQSAFSKHPWSHYGSSFFENAYEPHPGRRLLAVLDASDRSKYAELWLEDVSEVAEIVWRYDCSSIEQALYIAKDTDLPDNDYLLLDIKALEASAEPQLFASFRENLSDTDMICFSGYERMWGWIRFLEKK